MGSCVADVDVEELCASSKVARSGESGNGSLKDTPGDLLVDVILETYIEEESKGPAAAWKAFSATDTALCPNTSRQSFRYFSVGGKKPGSLQRKKDTQRIEPAISKTFFHDLRRANFYTSVQIE